MRIEEDRRGGTMPRIGREPERFAWHVVIRLVLLPDGRRTIVLEDTGEQLDRTAAC